MEREHAIKGAVHGGLRGMILGNGIGKHLGLVGMIGPHRIALPGVVPAEIIGTILFSAIGYVVGSEIDHAK